MPVAVPVPTKSSGELLTSALWNTYLRDNLNKLLERQHRVVTVPQFLALTGLEDGDEVYVEVDATNEIQWHLRYKLSTTRWRFLGGPALWAEILTAEGTTSATYVDLATAGPSITAPLAGVMEIDWGASLNVPSAPTNYLGYAAVKIGAAAAGDADAATNGAVGFAPGASVARKKPKTVARSDAIKLQYRTPGGGTLTATSRWLSFVPAYVTQA